LLLVNDLVLFRDFPQHALGLPVLPPRAAAVEQQEASAEDGERDQGAEQPGKRPVPPRVRDELVAHLRSPQRPDERTHNRRA
jgi:hypothetical protein